MSLSFWIKNTYEHLRSDGWDAVDERLHMLYNGSWRICCSRIPLGTNIHEKDWELLILLDGCRVDALRSLSESHLDVNNVGELKSVGSTSREWLAKTFVPEYQDEVEQTAYITANPYTEEIFSAGSKGGSPFNPANWDSVAMDDFLLVDEVWKDGWDEQLGTVPPRVVTDRAIATSREYEPKRIIVHYMQPHQPFIGEQARSNGQDWVEESCWDALRQGNAAVSDVREAYRENLAVVLGDVRLLLENVDADPAVVSADHGNAFGEWGIYGHPNGFLHPSVKNVPWLVTHASDERTHTPEASTNDSDSIKQTTEDRLRDLGYL